MITSTLAMPPPLLHPSLLPTLQPPLPSLRQALLSEFDSFFLLTLSTELSSPHAPSPPDPSLDVVEWSGDSPAISYSARTAEWLARVAEAPSHKASVVFYLSSEVLNGGSHPLRRVVDRLGGFISKSLAAWSSEEGERSGCSEGGIEAVEAAGALMESACSQLGTLVLSLLPPLQLQPSNDFVMETVRSSLFSRAHASLRGVVRGAYEEEIDQAREALIALGGGLLPCHLGVDSALRLDGEERPYASVIQLLSSLPLLTLPEQKLELVRDACVEIDVAISRYHSSSPRPSAVLSADDLIPIFAYSLVAAEVGVLYPDNFSCPLRLPLIWPHMTSSSLACPRLHSACTPPTSSHQLPLM